MDNVKRYEEIETLGIYFKDIKHYTKRLTKEEENVLSYKIQKGDVASLQKLMESNLPLVIRVAKKYRKYTTIPFSDLISEGNIGLYHACIKFDPGYKKKFSTYAGFWIQSYIRNYIDSQKRSIVEQSPDIDDKTITKIVEDNNINDDFESELVSINSRGGAVNEIVSCLKGREKRIIEMFFGLNEDKQEKDMQEISEELGVTTECVRQIKEKAIIKMKCNVLNSEYFDNYKELT